MGNLGSSAAPTTKAKEAMQTAFQRIGLRQSAQLMWDRHLRHQEQTRFDNDFEPAYRHYGRLAGGHTCMGLRRSGQSWKLLSDWILLRNRTSIAIQSME
jgi:hypothetical protein